MVNSQEWFDRKFPKDKDIDKITIDCEDFDENSLIIEDYPNLREINISDSEKIRKLTLKNLINLEKCTVKGCEVEQLFIENCPNIESLNVYNNLLTTLEFVKELSNLSSLEISMNKKISSGVECLPDCLEKFSYKKTELDKILETHDNDWKKYKQYLKEQDISEEESNRKELVSLKEEKVKIETKYKNLKENVGEVLTFLKNKTSNDLTTKEIISNLEKNVKEIVGENKKMKDDLEQFKPSFNEEAPVIEARKLGAGSFGTVYKGVWKSQFVAVKKAFAHAELAEIKKELKILKNLRSSYTIQYYSEYQEDDGIYIIMEYAEHGSLAKFITDNKDGEHDWQLNYNFIRQMVKGLRYLHSEKVLHRDLKSSNVLITEGYIAKLADFSLAKLLDKSNYSSSGEKLVGTIRWLAPEVLRGEYYSYQSDIYSLGMVMWEIVAKCTIPFKDVDNNLVGFHIVNNGKETIPVSTPEALVKIINFCWKSDPTERISLSDILNQVREENEEARNLKSRLIEKEKASEEPHQQSLTEHLNRKKSELKDSLNEIKERSKSESKLGLLLELLLKLQVNIIEKGGNSFEEKQFTSLASIIKEKISEKELESICQKQKIITYLEEIIQFEKSELEAEVNREKETKQMVAQIQMPPK